MFKTNFPGHNKFWGALPPNAPVATSLQVMRSVVLVLSLNCKWMSPGVRKHWVEYNIEVTPFYERYDVRINIFVTW